MTLAARGFGLASLVVFISAFAIAPTANAASTPTTAADVYIQIQGPEGSVYGFTASSAGKLSPISGSPFKPAGLIVGSTPTKFFTLGKDLIHSYGITSSGALGAQLAQMPILDYAGSGCGGGPNGLNGGVLDHTGKYFYVMLEGGSEGCAAYQSYIINSDGSFLFDGDTELAGTSDASLPSILGSERFAYADNQSNQIEFQRTTSGTLNLMPQFSPETPNLANGYYVGFGPDASPAGNYVALQLYPNNSNPPQLASYTVDSQGRIATTNTSATMPHSSLDDPYSTFSPTGNMFVLYADNGVGNPGNGIEIYNFNGAAPMTLYKNLLTGTPVDQVLWDSSNHLYAISRFTNKLYVFTVTPASITQDTAWSIGSPFQMVVVSR